MAGLARYASSAEPKFRPMASTWLNQDRWRGEADTAPPVTIAPSDRRMQSAAIILGRPIAGFGPSEARASPPREAKVDTIDIDPGDWHER